MKFYRICGGLCVSSARGKNPFLSLGAKLKNTDNNNTNTNTHTHTCNDIDSEPVREKSNSERKTFNGIYGRRKEMATAML